MVKVTTILVDFAGWSTVACVRNVAYSESRWLRFFWFFVFLVMVAVFIYQLVSIILKYLSFPSDTSTSIVFSSQPFPDVTFCSFNPFKLSEVEKNPQFGEIKKMLDEYKAAEQGATGGSNEFGFKALDRFARLDRANDLLVFLAAKLTEEQKAPAMYKIDELVTECLFAGQTCDAGAIEAVPDPVYGRCFAYRGGNQTITRTGLAHGLRLILTANLADSLTFVSDYVPTTSRVGVRMTVNERETFVDLDAHGVNVGVGYQTSIALSKFRTERARAPYGNCVNETDPGMNHYSDLPYSIDACYTTCMQRKFVERCGCAHPRYRKADNETWCSTVVHVDCIATHRGDQHNKAEPNLNQMDDCGCKPACNETQFRSTLSVLTYPAFGYTVGVGTTDQNKNQKQEQESKTTTTTSTTTTTNEIPTTITDATTKATTEIPTVATTTKCDYTTDPKYTTLVNYPAAGSNSGGKMFKQSASSDPCVPLFECDPSYSSEWWTCWPCFYDCVGGGRLPSAPYAVPAINCRDFFAFAKLRTGANDGCATARPDWRDWNSKDKYPTAKECDDERAMMTPSLNPVPIPTGSDSITNCTILEAVLKLDPTSFVLDRPYRPGCPKPNIVKVTPGKYWNDSWPCSYNCNPPRFPITGTYSERIVCKNFIDCFSIDNLPNSYTYRPSFSNWASGSGSISCSNAQTLGQGLQGPFVIGTNTRAKRSTNVENKDVGTPGKGSCESWNTNFKSVDDCKKWYKKNGMIVNVYYESLEYQVLTESASYSIPQAINDLGGQAGLWLGLSVVSVVECIGLLLMILIFCVTGKRMAVREHPRAKDDEDDSM